MPRILSIISRFVIWFFILLFYSCLGGRENAITDRKRSITDLEGLVAFWDFEHQNDGLWVSKSTGKNYPVFLRQIGDPKDYTVSNWPYTDHHAEIKYDHTGPLGRAVRYNRGYIYGSVPRNHFEDELLDLHGQKPFTMIAWVKFIGQRHLVAGIWDEGGWHKYAGRRQAALFAGLFNQKGVIAHVSATGAASYPQSEVDGSQYARIRAIDSMPFSNNEWVAMAMSFDPEKQMVAAYLNGEMHTHFLTDPVTQDVFPAEHVALANPLAFGGPIYRPTTFVIKYNGYHHSTEGVNEHRLLVDLKSKYVVYESEHSKRIEPSDSFRIKFDVKRNDRSLFSSPVIRSVHTGTKIRLPMADVVAEGDTLFTSLEKFRDRSWVRIGTTITKPIQQGAPFTFGRALGLASEEIEHGSQIFIDGVAIYDRVLSAQELRAISFDGVSYPNKK